MKTYFAYKNQIKGFEDVSETVKVIEKVAASSVHFLRQEASNFNVYKSEIETALSRLSVFYRKKDHFLLKKGAGNPAIVILTGEKGLVGSLWHDIVNAFLQNTEHYDSVIAVGTKGENYLKEEKIKILKFFPAVSDSPQEKNVVPITNYIFENFKKNTFSKVDILYPRFVSLTEQQPIFIPFLPFEFKITEKDKDTEGLPIFESSKKEVFDSLLQKYINMFFYKIVKETKLSELSARTVAMEHAYAKTNEFIRKSIFNYVKEHHRETTQKQLESFTAHKLI